MTKETLKNVYVFNHTKFNDKSLEIRHCSAKDSKDIEETFKNLNFNVTVYNDLDYSEILEKLSDVAKMDYSNIDCVVIFVLTHGRNGKVFAKDVDYYPDVYWKTLSNTNASLFSKPKLFFVQVSRGDESEDEIKLGPTIVEDSAPVTFSIPGVPDVLLLYSCYDGFNTWRSPVTGSWFVQSLCIEIKERARNTDILTLLTCLNQRMLMRQTGALTSRQIWTTVSTLTKLLYLRFDDNK
ncbi:hypothetical protein FQR65_LT00049 [Abscondita terminalis]|nr:hypothetical protein FQR65_LT00049 [Abscondita terminalis]